MDHVVQLWMAILYNVKVEHETFCYTISTSSWSQLPESPTYSCSLVIINNLLTLVGGCIRSASAAITNQLFILTREGSGRRWNKEFPPMLTKRSALCIETALIVAGGKSDKLSGIYGLQTVEVMSTETVQWSTAADLPQPSLWFAPASVCGEHVHILGNSSMYTCSLQALLHRSILQVISSQFQEQRC